MTTWPTRDVIKFGGGQAIDDNMTVRGTLWDSFIKNKEILVHQFPVVKHTGRDDGDESKGLITHGVGTGTRS